MQDHSAALALVSVHKADSSLSGEGNNKGVNAGSGDDVGEDPDMQRATDLLELHFGVKMNHMQGEDPGLRQARRDVDQVLRKLDGNSSGGTKTRG